MKKIYPLFSLLLLFIFSVSYSQTTLLDVNFEDTSSRIIYDLQDYYSHHNLASWTGDFLFFSDIEDSFDILLANLKR